MIDSETILNSDKNNYKLEQYIKNEKTKKKLVRDNKIKTSIGPRGSKGNKTIIKYFSNSKLMNLNLTKSILNFKNKNFEESLKYKTIPNLKNIKKIKDFKKKLLKNKTDKDDNGNGNNDELINNKNLKNELNEMVVDLIQKMIMKKYTKEKEEISLYIFLLLLNFHILINYIIGF